MPYLYVLQSFGFGPISMLEGRMCHCGSSCHTCCHTLTIKTAAAKERIEQAVVTPGLQDKSL